MQPTQNSLLNTQEPVVVFPPPGVRGMNLQRHVRDGGCEPKTESLALECRTERATTLFIE